MKEVNNTWFKPKPYPHFSSKIGYRDKNWLLQYLSNPALVATHSFFPFIRRSVSTRRYRKPKAAAGHTARRSLKRQREPDKVRQIFYATHIDAHLYAFYANLLYKKYKSLLDQEPQLSECILAYRRIPIPGKPGKHKCNIEFAHETFANIQERKADCVVLTFDVKSFFDTLKHDVLKQVWCQLLETDTLPPDHYNIYKSITKFRYADEQETLTLLHLHENDLRDWKKDKLFSLSQFKKLITHSLKVTKHEQEEKGQKGIPQGTPISAFLSNLYMLEFDRYMFELVVQQHGGIYRRYSDDILVVLFDGPDAANVVEREVVAKISLLGLTIQPEKTERVCFQRVGNVLKAMGNKPLVYLGFEFDGDRILLKAASLAKFYRCIKQMIKYSARRAVTRQPVKHQQALKIFRNRIYRHSHLSHRNYVSYVYRAAKVMDDDRKCIRRQIRNHWKIIHQEISKRELRIARLH